MGLVLTTVFGFIVWIVLWSINVKAFDAFMITVVIIVVGATVHILAPYLPANRD